MKDCSTRNLHARASCSLRNEYGEDEARSDGYYDHDDVECVVPENTDIQIPNL